MIKRLAIAIPAVALLAVVLLVLNTGPTLGCPAALATGTLAGENGQLVLRPSNGTDASFGVRWQFPFHVDEADGVLVVRDLFGGIRAREGDRVQLGGGVTEGGLWGQCGLFAVDPAAS